MHLILASEAEDINGPAAPGHRKVVDNLADPAHPNHGRDRFPGLKIFGNLERGEMELENKRIATKIVERDARRSVNKNLSEPRSEMLSQFESSFAFPISASKLKTRQG